VNKTKIEELLSTKEGKTKLAAAMAAPLRRRMSMNSVARQAFSVEPLIKCSGCGCEFSELHPDNGCLLGHVHNIMEI
jgi:hypothetical protein